MISPSGLIGLAGRILHYCSFHFDEGTYTYSYLLVCGDKAHILLATLLYSPYCRMSSVFYIFIAFMTHMIESVFEIRERRCPMSFGNRLRQLRKEKNLRQSDLASIINVNRATIGKYETDERFPDRKTLENIADYFQISIDYLLGRTDMRDLNQSYRVGADQGTGKEKSEASFENETVTIKELLAFVKDIRKKKENK
jgi:transcriptional regulator with XRE-family HTH domain